MMTRGAKWVTDAGTVRAVERRGRWRGLFDARAEAVARGIAASDARPHTHRPAFVGLMARAAVVGAVLGGVVAFLTSAADYAEWTLVVFQFVAIAALAVLPVALATRAVAHGTWRYLRGPGAGATPEELQLASRMMIAVGAAAIAAWVVLVVARWADTGQVLLI